MKVAVGRIEGGVEEEEYFLLKALDIIEFYTPRRKGILMSVQSSISFQKRGNQTQSGEVACEVTELIFEKTRTVIHVS